MAHIKEMYRGDRIHIITSPSSMVVQINHGKQVHVVRTKLRRPLHAREYVDIFKRACKHIDDLYFKDAREQEGTPSGPDISKGGEAA